MLLCSPKTMESVFLGSPEAREGGQHIVQYYKVDLYEAVVSF